MIESIKSCANWEKKLFYLQRSTKLYGCAKRLILKEWVGFPGKERKKTTKGRKS